MSHSFSIKFLSVVLAWTLCTPLLSVQAEAPPEAMFVTLQQPLQFLNPEGDESLVPSGTFSVKPRSRQLVLEAEEGVSHILSATQGIHSIDVPFPIAVLNPGEEAGLDDSDLLVVLYPDGQTLQAVGDRVRVSSRGIPDMIEQSEDFTDPSIITLEEPVYFTAPDGGPVVVESGTYTVEAAQPWIRLILGQDRKQSLLLQAEQETHETGVQNLLALSLPGGMDQELDVHQIVLMLPTGESLEATGSYSGIQKRGLKFKKKKKRSKKKRRKPFFKKKFPKAKMRYPTNPKRAGQWVKKRAQDVGKKVRQGMKYLKDDPKFAACYSTLWSARKAAWAASKGTEFILKYLEEPRWKEKLEEKAMEFIQSHQGKGVIKAMFDAGVILAHARNRKLWNNLTDPNHTCHQTFKDTIREVGRQIGPQLAAMHTSSNSEVRSRSVRTYQLLGATVGGQFALAKIVGGEFGAGVGWGFDGSKEKYVFAGSWVGTDAGVAGALQIGYWASIVDAGNKYKKGEYIKGIKGGFIGGGVASRDISAFLQPGAKFRAKIPIEFGLDFFWSPSELKRLFKGQPVNLWPTGVALNFIKGKSFKSTLDNLPPGVLAIPTLSFQTGATGLWSDPKKKFFQRKNRRRR